MGSQSLAEVKASFQQDGGASPAEGQDFGNVDGQMAQHLRRLSKRDSTTKVKALQVEMHHLSLPFATHTLRSSIPHRHTSSRLIA